MERVWWYLGLVGVVWCVANCGRETLAPYGEDEEVAELKGQALEDYKTKLRERTLVRKQEIERQGAGLVTGVLGNSLPGDFIPFASYAGTKYWTSKIVEGETMYVHPNSDDIIAHIQSTGTQFVRFSGNGPNTNFNIPIWSVDNSLVTQRIAHTKDNIYYTWDPDHDDCANTTFPFTDATTMWPEQSDDGHICIVDLVLRKSWELSKFKFPCDRPAPHCAAGDARCGTYNEWDIDTDGGYEPNPIIDASGTWRQRGGRGSGFSELAGMIRPEELQYALTTLGTTGGIPHALVFTSGQGRNTGTPTDSNKQLFVQPACRSDTWNEAARTASKYPIMGQRFRIDPDIDDTDIAGVNIQNDAVKVLIHTLQQYGAYFGDKGGEMAFQKQLLSPTTATDQGMWKALFGNNFFTDFEKIPLSWFQVMGGYHAPQVAWPGVPGYEVKTIDY